MIRSLLISGLAACAASSATATTYVEVETATLRALDKITGRSSDIEIEVGEPIVYGSLEVTMRTCYQTPPDEPPESAAYLEVRSTQPIAVESMDSAQSAAEVETVSEDNPELFSGWMFASSPGLSALQHPVYDIWVIQCTDQVEAEFGFDEDDDAGIDRPEDPLDGLR
ncbi:MAG: DUF2155 domain-containing protein [Pseudomonadota bacterium]